MKRIWIFAICLFFSLFLLSYKVNSRNIKEVDLNIKKGETGVLMFEIEKEPYVVFKTYQSTILLSFDKEHSNKVYSVLKKLGIFSFVEKKIDTIKPINDIIVTNQEGNIILSLEKDNFCIYEQGTLLDTCKYVYFRKEAAFKEIKLAFYDNTIDSSFEEELYNRWVDMYKLKKDSITYLKFFENTYNVINISKNVIEL